jgi:hypothetical protein
MSSTFLMRLSSPVYRVPGSFLSWLLFTFSFTGLFQTSGIVIGLGGYCASGGPYVIETECPEAVVIFAPLGIFGMLIAVGLALFFARSFGTPLFLWAWPILFVGLGGQFIVGAIGGQAIVTNILIGLMFVVMGVIPLWWSIRTGAQPFFIGMANVRAQPFSYRDTGRKAHFGPVRPEGELVPPTPGDWALALGLTAVAVGLGAWLSVLAFNAVGSAG